MHNVTISLVIELVGRFGEKLAHSMKSTQFGGRPPSSTGVIGAVLAHVGEPVRIDYDGLGDVELSVHTQCVNAGKRTTFVAYLKDGEYCHLTNIQHIVQARKTKRKVHWPSVCCVIAPLQLLCKCM